MEIIKNYSLLHHNTFGVECVASEFVEIESQQALKEVFKKSNIKNILIIGEGSNILFKSAALDSLVILNKIKGIRIINQTKDEVIIESGAGELWDDIVKYCVENNFGGIENLALIPGTVGAAPIQNIGAYGQELMDHFDSLTAIEIKSGKILHLNKSDCNFGYRNSVFKNALKNKVIITSVRLKLTKNPEVHTFYGSIAKELEVQNNSNPTINDVSKVVRKIRTEKLPDPKKYGNAGSFFKNPVTTSKQFEKLKKIFPDCVGYPENENHIKIPAAYLIEKCGLKDYKVGNVGTYPTQPLVIVNYGNASGKEVFEFAQIIRQKVFEIFHIQLEEEVNIV
jgi:UDP-N-acetylmuramate dehydrogenase